MARRQFTRELKLEAVRLVREQDISIAQVARDLDLHENVLRKCVRLHMGLGVESLDTLVVNHHAPLAQLEVNHTAQ